MSKRSRKWMAQRLPIKADFVTHSEDLDQNCAWEHFGGLALDEAKTRFAENALFYQEDFMFMGTNAFLFYFPVLDDYLRSVPDEENDDDWESWIIAQCIRAQFDSDTVNRLKPIATPIVELAEFVRDNIRRFGSDDAERQRVADAWTDLVHHIETLGNA
ncbi:hypothetical protein RMSM_00293 [Rhodopirellula maiorica SM1]|uniref:Uncharacterized protein n=1 Tax=Rhodopirellula maiorica SM1 TaxID=1265738 RepID=M5S9E6_9BACT|nr:hypothetical protein [Rhodopirellula maiorica]EMI22779.1 hypothetical protein RMSM_00293 [Rhodopirellula maiorica SM1]